MRGMMGRFSVLLIVLVTLSVVKMNVSVLTGNYVAPNKTIGCSVNQSQNPCLTLQEYISQPDIYFKNDTIFYFEPGEHLLNNSLKLENLSNITFQGLPDSALEVGVLFEVFVSVTWEKCWNIKMSSIAFGFLSNFTYGIVFNQVEMVLLHNIFVISGDEVIGCSSILCQQSEVIIRDCLFGGFQGSLGAAMLISESNATFIGKNLFACNTASYGGSLYLFKSAVQLNGSNIFMHNNSSNKDVQINCSYTLTENHPISGSGIALSPGSLGSGGAISCDSSTLIISNKSFFYSNYAQSRGGAISAEHSDIVIQGVAVFLSNFALGGGAMLLNTVTLKLNGSNIYFINNGAIVGGELLMHLNEESIKLLQNLHFVDFDTKFNMAANLSLIFAGNVCEPLARLKGGAIKSFNSNLTIVGKVVFINNTAFHGGAIFLARTKLTLSLATNISFIQNRADSKGGALYVKDSQCSFGSKHPTECFLSINSDDYSSSARAAANTSLVTFFNNSADLGSTLYGGQLHKCRLYYETNHSRDECSNVNHSDDALGFFMNISIIQCHNESESATNISSQADQIKFCEGENPLDNPTKDMKLHPGEEFTITVIALDPFGSPVPTIVFNDHNEYTGNTYRLRPPSRQINGSCDNITFQLLSDEENCHKSFKLYPDNPCQSLADGLRLQIDILACPVGFKLKDNRCECNSRLSQFTQRCTISKFTKIFERSRNNFWISQLSNADILIIHEYRCPLDYCKNDSVNVTLVGDPSVQCDFNRTGMLCGQCQKNFDLALGSLHCIPCKNNYHSALVLFFALAGVALIAVIFIFRLTVSVGTLSGLLFYANIIQANHQAFFPRVTTKVKFFTIFISWLNLDLGIETCFYDGMDIYAYSWLQFLFPFYLLFLVGCIILACHYSRSIAKQFGQNPVAVLATVLLMSFSKILQAIIVPLSWTHLVYYTGTPSNETQSVVWLYDASIHFFKAPKHTALGLFAISSLMVFVLPYVFLLFFGHWLQGCSNWWILSWLNKIKPFMDAYHAPYRKHTRYWTGLLLLSRLSLFLTFAINANGSESVNLIAVSSVSLALLAIQRRVYEHRWKDLLESSFIFNLGIFSLATFYLKEESKDASQFIISSISVGLAFIALIGILIYHVCLVFKSAASLWRVHFLPFFQKSHRIFKAMSVSEDEKIAEGEENKVTELHTLPTFSEIGVDLREPLLEIENNDSESRAATY